MPFTPTPLPQHPSSPEYVQFFEADEVDEYTKVFLQCLYKYVYEYLVMFVVF